MQPDYFGRTAPPHWQWNNISLASFGDTRDELKPMIIEMVNLCFEDLSYI